MEDLRDLIDEVEEKMQEEKLLSVLYSANGVDEKFKKLTEVHEKSSIFYRNILDCLEELHEIKEEQLAASPVLRDFFKGVR